MGIARTFTENAFYQIGSNLALRISSLFFIVFLAAILSPEEFGTYAWIVGIALLAEGIANIGSIETMINFVSVATARKSLQNAAEYFRYIFKLKLVALAIIAIIMLLFADIIVQFVFQKAFLSFPFQLAAIFLVFYSISAYFRSVFFATKNLKYAFYLNVFEAIIRILLVVGFVSIISSYASAITGYILSLVIIMLALFVVIRKRYSYLFTEHSIVEKKPIRNFMKYLMITSFATILLPNIDFLMISAFFSIESIGFYRIAISWANAIGGIIPFIMLAPYVIDLSVKGIENLQEGFNLFFKYNMVLTIPAAFGLAFFSKSLLSFFYKSNFETVSSELLFILSFLIMFSTSILLISFLFNAVGKPQVTTRAFVGAIILGFILNYFFLQFFGLKGIAIATVITYAVLFFSLFFLIKPTAKISMQSKNLIIPFISAMIMFGFLHLLPQTSNIIFMIIYIIFGAIIYFALLFATKILTISEILFLKNRILKP